MTNIALGFSFDWQLPSYLHACACIPLACLDLPVTAAVLHLIVCLALAWLASLFVALCCNALVCALSIIYLLPCLLSSFLVQLHSIALACA